MTLARSPATAAVVSRKIFIVSVPYVFIFLGLGEKLLAFNLHRSGADGTLGRSAEDCPGRHVELAAVAGAGHRGSVQIAIGERAAHVGTCVVEGVQVTVRVRHVHFRARYVEDAHLPVDHISNVTDPNQHDYHLRSLSTMRLAGALVSELAVVG